MVATKDPQLAAVVLGAGAYNFLSGYPSVGPLSGLNANIEQEAGTSAEAFRARSAIDQVDKIKAPILLRHGAHDERIPVRQAEAFYETLTATGHAVTMKIFPHATHSIPIDARYREISPFLEQSLRSSVCAGRPRQWSRVTGSKQRLTRAWSRPPPASACASLPVLARFSVSRGLLHLVSNSRQMPLRRHPTPVLVPPTDAVEGVPLPPPHINGDMVG
jgi:Prolyl oligopeptidase family